MRFILTQRELRNSADFGCRCARPFPPAFHPIKLTDELRSAQHRTERTLRTQQNNSHSLDMQHQTEYRRDNKTRPTPTRLTITQEKRVARTTQAQVRWARVAKYMMHQAASSPSIKRGGKFPLKRASISSCRKRTQRMEQSFTTVVLECER